MELSATTEFLFSLCFCASCIAAFGARGGDGNAIKAKVANALKPFLEDSDPWLGQELSKESLAKLLGNEILAYLTSREEEVTKVYAAVSEITKAAKVKFSYVDQSTLLDMNSTTPLDLSWLVGVDNQAVAKYVDAFLPLVYRKSPSEVSDVAAHYKRGLNCEIDSILRPTYPDCASGEELISKVESLKNAGVEVIDFYLLDTWRPRDLQRVADALERIA